MKALMNRALRLVRRALMKGARVYTGLSRPQLSDKIGAQFGVWSRRGVGTEVCIPGAPRRHGQENAGETAEDGGSYETWIADHSGPTGISTARTRALPAARNVTVTRMAARRVHL